MSETPKRREETKSRFPDGFRILQGRQEYITYLEHSSIRVWASDVAAHYDNHSHSAIEAIMPHRGVAVYQLQDEVFQVQPGEILILPSGCMHALTEPPETQRYLLLFEPNALMNLRDIPSVSAMMQQPIFLRADSELRERVNQLFEKVVECYFRKEPLWNTECYSYLLQAYAVLGRHYLETAGPQHPSQHSIDPAIMNSAITYINEHYMDEMSLEDAALFAGFSKYYFSRMFKQFSGISFSEYLTRKRLNVASDLLVRTDQSIREIAQSSGFGSMATFNRIFRMHKNCTPSQYRAIYSMALTSQPDKPIF
ncbi:MAG: helix-turn-helix transcriptional regulator [Clostridia bacterium]|nr:helix-turn-helix transcriptional regulator [Clostridia bacterium]